MTTTLTPRLHAAKASDMPTGTMKAMVYAGKNVIRLEARPKPKLMAPGDAIVRISHTTICGTDLHILKGDVPTATPGRVLGHEGVGVIECVGTAVSAFKTEDHVLRNV